MSIVMADFLVSLFGGGIVFSLLGNMAEHLGSNASLGVDTGEGQIINFISCLRLSMARPLEMGDVGVNKKIFFPGYDFPFIAFPQTLDYVSYPQLWAVSFYGTALLLGINSEVRPS